MNQKQTQFDWTFGLKWFVASAIGLVVGGMIAFATIWSVGDVVEGAWGETAAYTIVGGLFGAFFGLGASAGPGFLLQSKGVRAARWIINSVVAGAIGTAIGITFVLTFLNPDTMSQVVTGAMIGSSLGLPLGIGQWLVLRQHGLPANEWPVVSLVAFLVGMIIGLPLGGEGREWLSLAATALLVGAITGLGMVWSLRRQAVLAT